MRIADLVAQTLYAHGIRHAFGMPGGEVVTLIDALQAAGIEFVLCRNENAAAIVAAGASAATGAPGLLVTTLGPGLANAVNGIADAAQERVPLIVVSGVVEHGLRGQYTHQILDQAALLTPLVKASLEIEHKRPAHTVARALRLAAQGPMGPVHLQIAPDTAARAADAGDRPVSPAKHLSSALDPACAAVSDVAARLRNAERPLVLCGLEAARAGAGEPLRTLIENGQIPCLTTYKAKGIVDETHPLALGGAGLSPLADVILKPLAQEADVILLLGYDPIEMRAGWTDPFSEKACVIEVCEPAPDHGMHEASLAVTANVRVFLEALNRHSLGSESSARRDWISSACADAARALRQAFSPKDAFGPHTVFEALQSVLSEDAVVTADSGAHRILLSQQYRARKPFGLLQSAGFCTMGAAIPLAIGVKIEKPQTPVVAVLGDGGLEMTLGELGTLRDQNLPVVVVVLQDESLALIELKQAQTGLARAGISLGRTQFETIAEAFGGQGARVATEDALTAALHRALDASVFSLIVCDIQASDYVGSF